MKGMKGIDPQQGPNDLALLLAIVGWVVALTYGISLFLDWLAAITWFV